MRAIRAAKIVILDKDDNALVLTRSKSHPRSPLHADLPGGIIEENETFEVGLCREVFEETGLIVEPSDVQLIYTLTHDWFGRSVSRLVYAIRLHNTPDITLSWEHSSFSWQPIRSVQKMEKPYQLAIDYATEHDLWADI